MKSFEDIKTKPTFPELMLDKVINGAILHQATKTNPTLSPSCLGCQRAAAFKLSGTLGRDEIETYESNLAAEMGVFIHERLQKFMSASPIWVDVEQYISQHPELNLMLAPKQKHAGEVSLIFSGSRNGMNLPPFSFQCDGIVNIDNEYFIVEIKSESESAWQARVAPNPKHSAQAVSYAFLYGIPRILWIYASRESFGTHRKIYRQDIDERLIAPFIKNVDAIGKAVKNGSIQSLSKVKDCRYCAFLDECRKLDNK